jgi:8-amino-7-oxononanoate synthase
LDTGQLHTDQFPGRTLLVDNEEYLFFSGTSYLGIPRNQNFRSCLLEGMDRYGSNYSSSRNSNLQLKVFEEAEERLAFWTGAEAALTMSSGYMAGQVMVQSLTGSGRFVYAPDAHPALWRNSQDGFVEKITFEAWVSWLLETINSFPEQHILLVCNSLDPLKAKKHSFEWVASLTQDKQITLIIDDSHGLGITGDEGAGCYKQVKQFMPAVRLIVVSSLGKALGIPAGVILSDVATINAFRHSPSFGGASPAIPAYLYAFLQCGEVFKNARRELMDNIAYFTHRLQKPEMFRFSNHYPVFYTENDRLCPFLLKHNIMISSFRYPTPVDAFITRIVLNSLHGTADLDQLLYYINRCKV